MIKLYCGSIISNEIAEEFPIRELNKSIFKTFKNYYIKVDKLKELNHEVVNGFDENICREIEFKDAILISDTVPYNSEYHYFIEIIGNY